MSELFDPTQLKRIEATHRGFFYQHVYAAYCLINIALNNSEDIRTLGIERDEDIEISTDTHIYFLQVKTRQRDIQPADLADTINRFKEIQVSCEENGENRTLVFAVVANRSAGASLKENISKWPSNYYYTCPGQPLGEHPLVPEPNISISALLEAAEDAAGELAFPSLVPSTLVLKLAAYIQHVATGETDHSNIHTITENELPELFETYALQMQNFPKVPPFYRPQNNEPDLTSSARVRLISGFSGSGKTAWASMQALTSPQPMLYCDVSGYPSSTLASAIAREIVASLLGATESSGRLPAAQGFDALSWVSRQLGERQIRPTIVLDNIHLLTAESLRIVLDRAPNLDFILLGQPTDELPVLASKIGVNIEILEGWSRETVAAIFAEAGCPLDPASAERWRAMTGGLPLYVASAAAVSNTAYNGDSSTFLRELQSGVERETPAQTIIIEKIFDQLTEAETTILSLLGRAGVPLLLNEIQKISVCINEEIGVKKTLRRLTRLGLVYAVGEDGWRSHDALSTVSLAYLNEWPKDKFLNALTALNRLLFQSLQEKQQLDRLAVWIRLLPEIGQTDVLADIATNEIFHEVGNFDDLVSILENFASDKNAPPNARFTAVDALAYHEMQQDPRTQNIEERLLQMRHILESEDVSDADAPLTLAMKEMLFASTQNDHDAVVKSFEAAADKLDDDPLRNRILRYNFAVALYHLDDIETSLELASELALEIYETLDINPLSVIGATTDELRAMIGSNSTDTQDELKRLADCLSLSATCQRMFGVVPAMTRIHAAKFYQQAGAWRSMAREAQENAQDMLDLGDANAAIEAFEQFALPDIERFGLDSLYIEVSSFYAVTLAYAGRIDEARSTIAALVPYFDGLQPFQVEGVKNQMGLIEEIAQGTLELASMQFLKPAPLPFSTT